MLSPFRKCFKHIIEIKVFKLLHCIIEGKKSQSVGREVQKELGTLDLSGVGVVSVGSQPPCSIDSPAPV